MSESAGDERVRAVTYVPSRQKEAWSEHADRLEMSQAEFLRTMVQAGRRGFGPPERTSDDSNPERTESTDVTPGIEASKTLEDRVLAILREEGHAGWDDLVAAVTADIEDRLETAIEDLQQEGRIAHSPRRGYRVVEDGD